MYYFLTLLSGILVSVMIAVNGILKQEYGVYSAAVIIHIAGSALSLIIVLNRHDLKLLFSKLHAWYLYLGGAIGVFTTVWIGMAFGRISVSAILALGLFGQSAAGLIVDQYGWLGMPRHPFNKRKIIGLFLILAGIASMITDFEIIAVLVAFAAGVSIVVSRTLNARIAELTSVRISTLYNHIIGLAIAVFVLFLLGRNEVGFTQFYISPRLYIYFGGILGVFTVILSNMTVARVPAFYLTLIIFSGQVFSGIIIDIMISGAFSHQNLIGGLLVTTGLCANLLLDRKKAPASSCRSAPAD